MPAAEEGKTAAEESAAVEESAAAPTVTPEAEDEKVSCSHTHADDNTKQGCRNCIYMFNGRSMQEVSFIPLGICSPWA